MLTPPDADFEFPSTWGILADESGPLVLTAAVWSHFLFNLCVCACTCVHRGQPAGLSSLLPLSGSWGLDSGHQAWLQASFPTESSCRPSSSTLGWDPKTGDLGSRHWFHLLSWVARVSPSQTTRRIHHPHLQSLVLVADSWCPWLVDAVSCTDPSPPDSSPFNFSLKPA